MEQSVGGIHSVALYAVVLRLLMDWSLPKMYMATIYAIQAETGTLVWEKKLNIGVLPPLNDGLVAASDVVYAGTGKSLMCLESSYGGTYLEE